MCTLSILRDAERLTVTMNRDDAAQRGEAPPLLWTAGKTAFAAPKDLEAGGTWIGVNAHGVIACLLNRYDLTPPGRISRGAIVPEAMSARNVESACSALSALDHQAFAPFTCVLIDCDGAIRLDWTGSEVTRANLDTHNDAMVTSSSWQFEEVSAKRRELFHSLRKTESDAIARIAAFHTHRDAARDAWTPMMQRPNSQTKSVTQIELNAQAGEMRYWSRDAAISRRLSAPDTIIEIRSLQRRRSAAPAHTK